MFCLLKSKCSCFVFQGIYIRLMGKKQYLESLYVYQCLSKYAQFTWIFPCPARNSEIDFHLCGFRIHFNGSPNILPAETCLILWIHWYFYPSKSIHYWLCFSLNCTEEKLTSHEYNLISHLISSFSHQCNRLINACLDQTIKIATWIVWGFKKSGKGFASLLSFGNF